MGARARSARSEEARSSPALLVCGGRCASRATGCESLPRPGARRASSAASSLDGHAREARRRSRACGRLHRAPFAHGAGGRPAWPRAPSSLGRMTARIDPALPADGEACVVVGWSLGSDGRKLHAGTALLGADGVPCAVSRQVWIAPRVGAHRASRRLAPEPDRVQVALGSRRSARSARRRRRARRGCSGRRARRSGRSPARGPVAARARAASTAGRRRSALGHLGPHEAGAEEEDGDAGRASWLASGSP